MKVFHCDHCDHLLFFENTQCVACGHQLAFLPDLLVVGSLDPASPDPGSSGNAQSGPVTATGPAAPDAAAKATPAPAETAGQASRRTPAAPGAASHADSGPRREDVGRVPRGGPAGGAVESGANGAPALAGTPQPWGESAGSDEAVRCWTSPVTGAAAAYRLCANYHGAQVCNWAVDAADPNPLCLSCRLTTVIPDLTVEGNQVAWYRLEMAKRRLIYTLMTLGLPLDPSEKQPGVDFRFLADAAPGDPPVMTGHAGGVITVNVAEADDAERERRRHELREPYRTLLGHMRHEIGHYYWMRLVEDVPERLERFRALFGDERDDYNAALQRHYEQGPRADWQAQFVTAYASAHPWEDWAETWAHYLHMIDTLETAATSGLSLRPRRKDEPALSHVPAEEIAADGSFDRLLASWYPVTYLLNNLNRGMGMADAYPFVLSPPAVEKLRFVHEAIGG